METSTATGAERRAPPYASQAPRANAQAAAKEVKQREPFFFKAAKVKLGLWRSFVLRYWYGPEYRSYYLGFRVVAAASRTP